MAAHAPTRHARERLEGWASSKWTLEKLLGVGGTASVYAARHRNGARAAIKILHRELADDENLRRRFLREALIANSIDHPAVVRVLDDDEWAGEPFLVMELVDGRTLADIAAERTLDQAELLDVAEQLLEALVVAHARSVIHRDIKPQNLLLDGNGRVRILDFGIARVLDDDAVRTLFTTVGAIWGTLEYMAPELLSGSAPAGVRTDVYGVGATLFTLATNEYLHDEPDTRKRVLCAVTRPGRSLAAVTDRFTPEVAALVDRATRFAPGERWDSAAQMLREIRRLRAGVRAPNWARRRPSSAPAAKTPSAPPPGTGGTRAFGLPAWVAGPPRAAKTRPYRAPDVAGGAQARAMAALQHLSTQRMDLSSSAAADLSAATAFALPEPLPANVQYAELDESGERPRLDARHEAETTDPDLDWAEVDPEPTIPSGRFPTPAPATPQRVEAPIETAEEPQACADHVALADEALPSRPAPSAKRTIVSILLAACAALVIGGTLREPTRSVAPPTTAVVKVQRSAPVPPAPAHVPEPPASIAPAPPVAVAAAPTVAPAETAKAPAATAPAQRPQPVKTTPAKKEPSLPGYKDLPTGPY